MIDSEKKQLGVMPLSRALDIAREQGFDLVEIAPLADPPVCRIMDYGKFIYEEHKREQEAKKHQKQVQVKEVKFRPKISIHDYDFKMRHVRRFLGEGNKVKITIMLRGRERSKPELGQQILGRVLDDVREIAVQDGNMRRQDWMVSALVIPIKTAAGGKDAKAKNPQGRQKETEGHGEKKGSSPQGE